ncbi:MAG: pyruvate dehydrogenase [Geminicoccaceae bacterium]|nr:pyruvate dehydrogenase [Geminicoccaceae bacterium]
MPTEILMPALSPTMTEGNLARWLKAEGDPVAAGEVIAEIETDKATMEIEAIDDGTLGRILVAEGAEGIAVNTPIALLLAEGEDAAALDRAAPPAAPAVAESPAPPRPEPSATTVAVASVGNGAGSLEDEIPAGTAMVRQTVREALRDAMAEEMRRDPDVFLMGEEVASAPASPACGRSSSS